MYAYSGCDLSMNKLEYNNKNWKPRRSVAATLGELPPRVNTIIRIESHWEIETPHH